MIETIPGLTKPEYTIYMALLKLKNASVRDIAKETGFHRTNIYDIMEKLKEKGLVSFYKEGNTNYFKCANPKNLYNYLDEQKAMLDKITPQLSELYKKLKEETEIEIFKGRQGLLSAFKDILRENKPTYAFGVSAKLKEYMPIFREQFIQTVVKQKMPYKLIYTRRITKLPKPMEMKILKKEFVSPMEVHFYGNKTLQIIWEPDMRAILINSKKFTEAYKKHFVFLWKIAKK